MTLGVLALFLSYLVGSVSFAYLAGRLKGMDLRRHGSGNLGATNVLRTLGAPWAVGVLALDAGKGVAAVLLVPRMSGAAGDWLPLACGVAAIVGHVWPVFLGFRGGKGVATAAGAILRRSLPAFGVAFGAFLAARMAVALLARPAYATPLTTMEPVPVGGSTDRAGQRHGPSVADWIIEHGYADANGRRLSWTEYYELEDAANRAGTNLNQFLHARGIQQFEVYHPADRFWTFQLIEAALFVAVAAILIGVVVWRVRRRMI